MFGVVWSLYTLKRKQQEVRLNLWNSSRQDLSPCIKKSNGLLVALLRLGLDMFLCSQTWGSLTKLGKKDETQIVGIGNAGFMDHKDIWQSSQD